MRTLSQTFRFLGRARANADFSVVDSFAKYCLKTGSWSGSNCRLYYLNSYNKGEGIRLALALGADPAGDFSSFHAEPLDPRSHEPEALVMNFPYGNLVNKLGARFTDEAPGPVDVYYDHRSRAIKDEPDGIAWVTFDQKMLR